MKYFIDNQKELKVFGISLLVSVLIWLFMSLSYQYKTSHSFQVKFENIPTHKELVNDSMQLQIDFVAKGWDLLFKEYNEKTIVVNVEDLANNNWQIAHTKSFAQAQFPLLKIENVQPAQLLIQVEDLLSKKVAIRPKFQTNFPPNYFISTNPILQPDSIIILGRKKVLNKLLFIETETIILQSSDSIIDNIILDIPKGVKTKTKNINAQFSIEEYVEKEIVAPIFIDKKPKAVDMVFYPQEVKLSCLVPLAEYQKISSADFYISADFDNIELQNDKTAFIYVKEKPLKVKNIQLEEEKIEFIIYQ